MKTYTVLFLLSALITWCTTPLVIRLGCRLRLLDVPDRGRKLHRTGVPRLGGVGIFVSFFLSLGLLLLFPSQSSSALRGMLPQIWKIMVPATLVFLLGLADDVLRLPAKLKFFCQCGAASLLWFMGMRIEVVNFPLVGQIALDPIFGFAATVFWLVLVTNAFNFIDGMDGLAAGIALFSSLSVMILSILGGHLFAPMLAAPLAGACLGFLRYNWHPAKIFMGDGGSYFLGFTLGAMALFCASKAATLTAIAVPIAIVGVPLVDTFLAVVRRFLSGQPLFVADGEHMHHRLLKTGISHHLVVLIMYGITVAFGFLAFLNLWVQVTWTTASIPLFMAVLMVWLVRHLDYEEFAAVADILRKAMRFQRQGVANHVRLLRFIREMKDAKTPQSLFLSVEKLMGGIGFDAVLLQLRPQAPPQSPPQIAYQWTWAKDDASHLSTGDVWVLRIPLRTATGIAGHVFLLRAIAKKRLLIQMGKLIETLGTALEGALGRFPEDDLRRAMGPTEGRPCPNLLREFSTAP